MRLYIVCEINNDELFFNAFPFENKLISFYFLNGLDMVRSTGNLSSIDNGFMCTA